MKPTLFPSCDRPTIELATDPPDIVFSIFLLTRSYLNSNSLSNIIVLLVKTLLFKKLSSTLQITSQLRFYFRIFISSLFCQKFLFHLGNSFENFEEIPKQSRALQYFNTLKMKFIPVFLRKYIF